MSDPSSRAAEAAGAGPGRVFTPFQRRVCVPLGFLWLVLIGIVAIPVLIYMTLLYHAAQAGRGLFRARRGPVRGENGEADERVA